MFFYEGRTIRGLSLMRWALLLQLAEVVATGATLAALGLLLGPALANPGGFLNSLLGIVGAVCAIELGQVAVAVIFLVGFVDLHAGRHEYGLAHARGVDRATVLFIVVAALSVISVVYSLSTSLFAPAAVSVPAESLLNGNAILSPLAAVVAGLGLIHALRALTDEEKRRRLRAALVLGVIGSVIGPAFLALSVAANPHDLSAITTGLLASAVGGDGLCALSLLLFALLYREVRLKLMAGIPAPALPRYAPPSPWAWPAAPPPGTVPPGPMEPPKSRL